MSLYKVLVGQHIQNGPDGKERVYNPGEIFENNGEMVERSSQGVAPKFQKVSKEDMTPKQKAALDKEARAPADSSKDSDPVLASTTVENVLWTENDLKQMTKAELTALAEEDEIEVNPHMSKDQLVSEILAHQKK